MEGLYQTTINWKMGEMTNNFDVGYKVLVKNKSSRFYLQTGTIKDIFSNGDCLVKFDFIDQEVVFDEYKLIRIDNVVEIPTGEVIIIPHDDMLELSLTGIIKYNRSGKYYYFGINDRWQIDRFSY